MKRASNRYICQACGQSQVKWSGKCPTCGTWNSLLEEAPSLTSPSNRGRRLETTTLAQVNRNPTGPRLSTQIGEFDRVLGGGIIPGSLILLAGEPGIGKSTLLLEVANGIVATKPVLYVSGEESLDQLKLRAQRLGVKAAKLELASANNADDVATSVGSGQYGLVIVDSIQTMVTEQITSAAGTISQITASTQALLAAAKPAQTAVILTGHVTKEGNIAGPKILEHIVDVVLYLEGERFSNFKLIRGHKNRYGSTFEVGIFEMHERGLIEVTNPSAAFLQERQVSDGSVVLATLEGTRPLLVEVQALVSPSPFGYPKRTTAGFDLNRLNLLLAVLGKRGGIALGTHDVYVNVVGGMRVAEPAADLAVVLAVASAARGKPLSPQTAVYGEVGLSGEVRSVAQAEKRVQEAQKLGFSQIIAPAVKPLPKGLTIVGTISQAIKLSLVQPAGRQK
ncbi:DNA repair protein RadA [Candidatus Microgenomates bacterium]|nr:DNA repair protein RadA [Candidatus Microgenomates bacterium]